MFTKNWHICFTIFTEPNVARMNLRIPNDSVINGNLFNRRLNYTIPISQPWQDIFDMASFLAKLRSARRRRILIVFLHVSTIRLVQQLPLTSSTALGFCKLLLCDNPFRSPHHRRLVRNRQTLFVRIVFFYWKTTWDCLARGVFSIGYRGFRHLDTLLDGSNDFDETLIEYGPGLHLPGGMGNYSRKIQLEKAQRKNVLSMLKPIGFFGGAQFQLNFSQNPL